MHKIKIRLTFTEKLLGTASSNPELHEEFIAGKSADKDKIKEEMASLPAEQLVEKTQTIFPKENGQPFVWDYQIKGFFKDACSMLSRITDTESNKLKAYKKIIDGLIFVFPRKIMIKMPKGTELGNLQRPLRGQTAQGERIALANSETVPVGSFIEFEVMLLDKKYLKQLKEWLDYGQLRGLGQWRNASWGRVTWEELKS